MKVPTLLDLHHWLSVRLGPDSVMHGDGKTTVSRLALALEARDLPGTPAADALWLHRSYHLPEHLRHWPLLGSHDGFDAALATGENRALAEALGWKDVQALHLDRADGLLATPPQREWGALLAALDAEFGGQEVLHLPEQPAVSRLAYMNAMRPGLLNDVAERGAQVYVTGQMRPGALTAARNLGLGVIALGHRRTEVWGLRQLGRELGEAFPGLDVQVYVEQAVTPPSSG